MPSKGLSFIAQKLKEKSRNEILISKKMNDVIRENFKTHRYGVVDAGTHVFEAFEVLRSGNSFAKSESSYSKSDALADLISKVKKNEEIKEAEKRLSGENKEEDI